MDSEIYQYAICFALSFGLSGTIVLFLHRLYHFGSDCIKGPQKIHDGSVPRVGGLAIFVSLIICLTFIGEQSSSLLMTLALPTLPIMIAGLLEDCTGSISPKLRLTISLISGVLFCWITGYRITNVDVDMMAEFLNIPAVSVLLTSLAIASLINAINIIDGLNGLAAITAAIMIVSFGILSGQAGDLEQKIICSVVLLIVAGFLVWNFPFGKIFLGDGGAYFLGAMVAGLAVLMPERNSEVSPFASLLIVIYPFYELVRSTFRRIATKGLHAFTPDNSHLHSLMYLVTASLTNFSKSIQNSLAAIITLTLPLLCCFWAVIFFDKRGLLLAGVVGFILIYESTIAVLNFILVRKKII
jgi:UDP-N-acetylmuramyl pentapeptide phosphotransferase/UDP-N-acetylglucosamine-1-phosphate transferase